jgi:hypothetical protein
VGGGAHLGHELLSVLSSGTQQITIVGGEERLEPDEVSLVLAHRASCTA